MAKDIVLLFDGTSNGIEGSRTNILRLYGCLTKNPSQVVYYDPGIGTLGQANAWSRMKQQSSELWGMVTGHGLDANVKQAYRFLVDNYRHKRDSSGQRDRISLFGYSRGAYTARVLAGFLHNFGLIDGRNTNLLDYAYRAYKRISEKKGKTSFEEMRLYERVLRPVRPKIYFLGLFDTVGSVIEPGPNFLPRRVTHESTGKNASIRIVRHAVALEERRRLFDYLPWEDGQQFRPNRFKESTAITQDAKEVWFAGTHGDVGGGHPETESGLAKVPLEWMIEEARTAGLQFKTRTINEIVLGKTGNDKYVPPNALADSHESLSWRWWIVEFIPKISLRNSLRVSIPRGRRRAVPSGAHVHWSVIERFEQIKSIEYKLPQHYKVEP